MTIKGKSNHYNIKFLKGYGVSIRQKQNQIFITNGKEPFTNEQDQEAYYVTELPYEKIVDFLIC